MPHQWVTLESGRQVYRNVEPRQVRRSSFPCPMLIKDQITPVQSQADGQWHDSMSSLRRSYRADGNPQGIEYTEVGDEDRKEPQRKRITKQECADLLDKAEAAISRGEIPS